MRLNADYEVSDKTGLDALTGKGAFFLVGKAADLGADLVKKFREVGLANADMLNFALLSNVELLGATSGSLWYVKGEEKAEVEAKCTAETMEKAVTEKLESSIPLVGVVDESNYQM